VPTVASKVILIVGSKTTGYVSFLLQIPVNNLTLIDLYGGRKMVVVVLVVFV